MDDLKKAQWYLARLIAVIEGGENHLGGGQDAPTNDEDEPYSVWKDRMKDVSALAEKKDVFFGTAAEFTGRKTEMLEANRKELFKGHPITGAMGNVTKKIASFLGEE